MRFCLEEDKDAVFVYACGSTCVTKFLDEDIVAIDIIAGDIEAMRLGRFYVFIEWRDLRCIIQIVSAKGVGTIQRALCVT